jgi:hypothetical protein
MAILIQDPATIYPDDYYKIEEDYLLTLSREDLHRLRDEQWGHLCKSAPENNPAQSHQCYKIFSRLCRALSIKEKSANTS